MTAYRSEARRPGSRALGSLRADQVRRTNPSVCLLFRVWLVATVMMVSVMRGRTKTTASTYEISQAGTHQKQDGGRHTRRRPVMAVASMFAVATAVRGRRRWLLIADLDHPIVARRELVEVSRWSG